MMLYFLLLSNSNFVSNLFGLPKTHVYTITEITFAHEHFVHVGKAVRKTIVGVLVVLS